MSTQGQGDVVGPPNTRFVSKPVEIEAHRIGIDPWPDAAWEAVTRNEIRLYDCGKPDGYIIVRTLEGEMRGNHGDWLIRGTEGEFYPCKPSVFERKYEARTLLSSSRGEQAVRERLTSALKDFLVYYHGTDEQQAELQADFSGPDGMLPDAEVRSLVFRNAQKALAESWELDGTIPSAPGSVPTSLAGQGTDTCTCDEFQSCPRCHTANLDPDWLEKELAEVAPQPTAGGDAPTPADERPEDYNCPKCGDIIHSRAHGIEGADCSCVKWEGPK